MSTAKTNDGTFSVYTTASEPEALFGTSDPWPPSVTIRRERDSGAGIEIEVSGERDEVFAFIARYWGEQEVQDIKDWLDE